ncbi:MAG: rhodanese-like domain-containing protein [Acidimicrobiia bacterium]
MEVPEIDATELDHLRGQAAALIDVREPDEYVAGHVPGAVLVPLASVPDRLDEVPEAGTVYVICASGSRSLVAAEYYRSQGRDAVNVAGGTKSWMSSGHPVSVGMEP